MACWKCTILHLSFWLIKRFSNFPRSHKNVNSLEVWKIFLKVVHQKGLFDAIKENSNFLTCRRILHIYRQWLLNWSATMYGLFACTRKSGLKFDCNLVLLLSSTKFILTKSFFCLAVDTEFLNQFYFRLKVWEIKILMSIRS